MRLFAAIDPPADEIAALSAAVDPTDGRLRWVRPEQWHVTLAFYGEVAVDVEPDLTERLRRAAARTPPFDLRVAGAGTFPSQAGRARMLWAGLTGDVDVLSRLADRCSAAGRRAGVDMEDRKFRPHLTLARARRDVVDLRETVDGLSSYAGRQWQVTSMRLVHSTLGAQVRHETLASLALGGHQA